MTLRALQNEGKLNILSRPYILTSDNQTARITVGERVPFITNTRETNEGQTINTIQYEDIGIILEVTPSINPEGLVIMDIAPEISETTKTTVRISETVYAPVYANRSSQTRVAVRDGQTIAIGGLVQDKIKENIDKVPLLGDLPLLGGLFRRTVNEKSKTELLIFLTPHVATNDEDLQAISEAHSHSSNIEKDKNTGDAFRMHMENMLQADLEKIKSPIKP
jgi:general secretion pathway protein D